jgi:proteic killer suppression protein
MIRSFRDRRTEDFWNGRAVARFRSFAAAARRKLDMVNAAQELRDLRVPPGNRLEALKGDLAGRFSIRINDRWRICFEWAEGDAHDVEIVDYHKG